jgi:hypothetical protein
LPRVGTEIWLDSRRPKAAAERLSLCNIDMEEVRGEVNGKSYKWIVYSALNDSREKVGNPFKSSLFGKSVGVDTLEKRIEKSAEIIKSKRLKERGKKVIAAAMRSMDNRIDFEKALERQGMSVVFRINDEGCIYGATFVDHEQKYVFNGSRLGKEFSANVFNDLFNDKHRIPEQVDNCKMISSLELFTPSNSEQEEGSGISGLLDLLTPEFDEFSADDRTFFIHPLDENLCGGIFGSVVSGNKGGKRGKNQMVNYLFVPVFRFYFVLLEWVVILFALAAYSRHYPVYLYIDAGIYFAARCRNMDEPPFKKQSDGRRF